MSFKNFCPQVKHVGFDVGQTVKEDEERDSECFQPVSPCPTCNQQCDTALILPCSHPMCARCVAAGETTSSGQSVLPGVCSVLCHRCRHPVELPCWTWSSATSCLPKHPTPSPACVRGETGNKEGPSEDQDFLQHAQRNRTAGNCRNASYERTHSCLGGSIAASSPIIPVDGVVDLQEDEMEQSVFGLCFALDPSSVPPSLHLSSASLTVIYQGPHTPPPHGNYRRSKANSDLPYVCTDVVIKQGQYYWEVDVCNSSVYRIGVMSSDGSSGWWLQRQGTSFCAVYDGSWEPLCTVPPQIKSLGVFLNIGGGVLSFFNPLTQEHLAMLPTTFSPAGVFPAVGLGEGRLKLRCSLPPPPYIFLAKDSTYKGPCGTDRGRWCREVPFKSVRKVIQKFEELAVSDSDSGLVSSFGSSCSTLASNPDMGIPQMYPSGHEGQETGSE